MTSECSRILFVDDSKEDFEFFEMTLKRIPLNYQLDFCASAQETEHYLNQKLSEGSLPQLVVLDIGLPESNGLEILSTMKAHPVLKDLPVVIYSGSDEKEDLRQAYRRGGAMFMRKPCNEEILSILFTQLKITNRI